MDYSGLTDAELWTAAVAFFAPLAISVIQQSKWSERTQSLVAFGFYFVVALVSTFLAGMLDLGNLVRALLLVFLVASVSYKTLWKPTGVAPAIESATSPSQYDAKHAADTDPE
jgi:hypothetical protein